MRGIEPPTFWLQISCSAKLSYTGARLRRLPFLTSRPESPALVVFVLTPGNSQHGQVAIMAINQTSAAAWAVVVPVVAVECFFMA